MKKTYILEDLCCANCAAKMENAIRDLPNIQDASLSFMTRKLVVEMSEENAQDTIDKIKAIVKKIDSDVEIIEK